MAGLKRVDFICCFGSIKQPQGAKNIYIGVAWKPESDDEWIEIQSIRMYIEKNE